MAGLFCYLLGDREAFPVEIPLESTVGALKESIRDKKHSLKHLDANQLQLWHLELNDDDNLKSNAKEAVKTPRTLRPTHQVSALFSNGYIPKGKIHFIVKLPDDIG